jgi:hypothetical protein
MLWRKLKSRGTRTAPGRERGPGKKGHDYESRDETENDEKKEGYEMLPKGGAERTEKLNTVDFGIEGSRRFPRMKS